MQYITQQSDIDLAVHPVSTDVRTGIVTVDHDAPRSLPERNLGYLEDGSIQQLARNIAAGAARRLVSIQAVILLEGSVRPSPFSNAIRRSITTLPVTQHKCLREVWTEQVKGLGRVLGEKDLPCRLMIGGTTPGPAQCTQEQTRFTIENDPAALRGTGGVLRDIADQYPDEAHLVIANAAQLLISDLAQITIEAAEMGGDVTIAANSDGSPSNVMLISCKALRELPRIGFVDLKEQGLPLIKKKYRMTVIHANHAFGVPIRNSREYLAAVRSYHRRLAGEQPFDKPFTERWESSFSIVEAGARVDQHTQLHDSVVLAGGIVEAGASAIRSVVCDGGKIHRNGQSVDSLVAGPIH